MFSKFIVVSNSVPHAIRSTGPGHIEAAQNFYSLPPLVKHYDHCVRALRAENEKLRSEKTVADDKTKKLEAELIAARAEALQVQEQVNLFTEEVAQSRMKVKSNTTTKSYWEVENHHDY